MKKDTHPAYQEVLFVDSSTGYKFVCGSTLQPKQTEVYEGKEYPVYHVSVSSSSHPFFTGSKQFIDSEGRVNKFMKRYAKAQEQHSKQQDSGEKEEKKEKPKKEKTPKKK